MSAGAHTAAALGPHCRNNLRRWMMTRAVMTAGVVDIDTAKLMPMVLTVHPAAYTLHYTHHGPYSRQYSEAAAAVVVPPPPDDAHPAKRVDDSEPGDTECETWDPCDVEHHHMNI